MAPLSLFRGQGGTTNTSAAAVAVDPLPPPEPPRTPPPDALRRTSSGGTDPLPSPSRLNPARLLRRKGSRLLRDGRDGRERERDRDREEGWFGALGRHGGHSQMSTSTSGPLGPDKWFGLQRQSGSSSHGPDAGHYLRPSPSIRSLHAHQQPSSSGSALASTTASTTEPNPKTPHYTSHSRQRSSSSATVNVAPNPNGSSNAPNFGSVRSFRSIRSDGASSHGDTEIITGPSHDHRLVKGDSSVLQHHPFLLPSSGPMGSQPTTNSPPHRPARSPVPPPPPPPPPPRGTPHPQAQHHGDSRPSTPSSGSAYSDLGDNRQSAAPPVMPHHSVGAAITDPADKAIMRADTAAWLARRPSGRRPVPLANITANRGQRSEIGGSDYVSPSASATSASGESVDEPLTPTISPRLASNPPAWISHHAPVSAVTSPSPPPRPSPAPPPPNSQLASQVSPRPRTPDRTGFIVSVQCLPATDDEVRWEVVLRRAAGGLDAEELIASPAPSGPVRLTPGGPSSGTQSVHAPPFASSVNLSLALDTDAPNGKLVFITLPGATPTRMRSRSISTPGGAGGAAGGAISSPRPNTRQAFAQSPPNHPLLAPNNANTLGQGSPPSLVSVFDPPASRSPPSLSSALFTPPALSSPPASARRSQPSSLSSSSLAATAPTSPSTTSALGPPAPLTPQKVAHSQVQPPYSPPSQNSEPLSPQSSAYKRQGAVWSGAGGLSPLSGEGDVFSSNGDLPSRRAAQGRAGLAPARRAAPAPDSVNPDPEYASARQSFDGMMGRV